MTEAATGSHGSNGTQEKRMAACEPRSCGAGPNVSYPFWIDEFHPPYCGMRLFRLTCGGGDGGYPVLPISDDNYYVYNISYHRGSMELKMRIPSVNSSCGEFPNRNLTLERTPLLDPKTSNTRLFFYFRCNRTLLPSARSGFWGIPSESGTLWSLPCDPQQAGLVSFVGYAALGTPPDHARLVGVCSPPVILPIAPFPADRLVATLGYEQMLDFRITLNYTASSCATCQSSGGRCGTNFTDNGGFSFVCICRDRDRQVSCDAPPTEAPKTNGKLKIIGVAVCGAALSEALVIFIICRCRVCFKKDLEDSKTVEDFLEEYIDFPFHQKDLEDSKIVEDFLEEYTTLALKRYKFSDLKNMTTSFSEKLGEGGYSRVFKGTLEDGRHVAVKLLNEYKGNGQEFMNEVACIGRANHVNIVTLVGFCTEGSKRALVYEFMANGSLEKFLSNTNPTTREPLQWEDIYKIVIGISKGLEYLHKGCNTRVVHFDIKPHNILLDEDFNPRISDFGLAKLCPSKDSVISMNIPRGTIGYIAPEVFSRCFGVVSRKSDVYSYGMLVLEMVGIRNNMYVQEQSSETSIYFPHWIYEQVDEIGNLNFNGITTNEYDHDIVKKMILIGLWCIQTNPTERPSISKVVEMFDGKSEELVLPPKPYLLSSTSSIKELDSTSML